VWFQKLEKLLFGFWLVWLHGVYFAVNCYIVIMGVARKLKGGDSALIPSPFRFPSLPCLPYLSFPLSFLPLNPAKGRADWEAL